MSLHKQLLSCIGILSICLSLFTGCSGKEQAKDSYGISETVTVSADSTEVTSSETKAITVSVVNLSKIDAGMFSVIDPATGEQLNVDNLASGETVSLDCNWPVDTKEFQWALYNLDGELCIEASTDISEAKDKVSLVLIGTNTIENVEVMFE